MDSVFYYADNDIAMIVSRLMERGSLMQDDALNRPVCGSFVIFVQICRVLCQKIFVHEYIEIGKAVIGSKVIKVFTRCHIDIEVADGKQGGQHLHGFHVSSFIAADSDG